MKTEIFKDYNDFLKRKNKDINGVSEEFAKAHPYYEADNETNTSCWECSDCSDCSWCVGCSHCYECEECFDCFDCFECFECYECKHLEQGRDLVKTDGA